MRNRIYILILLLFAAVSCEYTLDGLPSVDSTGYICIQALAVQGDTTVIHIRSTAPLDQETPVDIDGAEIRLTADGREVGLERNDGVTRSFPQGMYFTSESFAPGCRLEITASHPELPAAKTSTEIPGAFPAHSVQAIRTLINPEEYIAFSDQSGGNIYSFPDAVRVRITFTDDPSSRNIYGLRIVCNNGYFDRSQYYMTYSERLLSVNEENHTMIINPSSVFGKTAYNVERMVMFSDAEFNGETVTKEYLVPLFKDMPKFEHTYRLELFMLSEGFWRCAESEYNLSAGGLGEFGQQSLFPYTNVAGGLGAFGAVSALTVETLQID